MLPWAELKFLNNFDVACVKVEKQDQMNQNKLDGANIHWYSSTFSTEIFSKGRPDISKILEEFKSFGFSNQNS